MTDSTLDKTVTTDTSRYVLEEFVRNYEILPEFGMHARPSAALVKVFGAYDGEGFIRNVSEDNEFVSLKSIMGLMTLEGYRGSEVEIKYTGRDASEVLNFLETSTLDSGVDSVFFRPLYDVDQP